MLSHFSFLFPSIYVSLQFWKRISWSEAMEWNGSRWLVTLFLYFPCIPLNSSTLSILFVLILFYLQYLIITIKTPAKKNFFFVQFRLYIPKKKKKKKERRTTTKQHPNSELRPSTFFSLLVWRPFLIKDNYENDPSACPFLNINLEKKRFFFIEEETDQSKPKGHYSRGQADVWGYIDDVDSILTIYILHPSSFSSPSIWLWEQMEYYCFSIEKCFRAFPRICFCFCPLCGGKKKNLQFFFLFHFDSQNILHNIFLCNSPNAAFPRTVIRINLVSRSPT